MDQLKQKEPKEPQAPGRNASFAATMKAVFWSFFGVRKRSDYEQDSASLNPLHLVLAALIGVLLFIGVLVMLVKIALAQ